LVSLGGSGEALKELENEIHKINSLANIIHSVRCQVDLSKILNCRAYDSKVSHIKLCLFFFFLSACYFHFHIDFYLNGYFFNTSVF
jgi:hypothetical protein